MRYPFEVPTTPPLFPSGLGGLISLLVHSALIIPAFLAFHRPIERTDPIERMVMFLVPPDQAEQRQAASHGVDWSAVVGTGGVVTEPPHELVVEPIPTGPAGGDSATNVEALASSEPIETALSEVEVDSTVERDPTSAAPIYPPLLLQQQIEGSTFVHYVVDTTGRVDSTTIRVVRTTHTDFADAVRGALMLMRFRPAIHGAHAVRQWVEQNFSFRIQAAAPPPPANTRVDR
ncbi:MAG: energy transducer TonB [Gemmatimonadota bacterium]